MKVGDVIIIHVTSLSDIFTGWLFPPKEAVAYMTGHFPKSHLIGCWRFVLYISARWIIWWLMKSFFKEKNYSFKVINTRIAGLSVAFQRCEFFFSIFQKPFLEKINFSPFFNFISVKKVKIFFSIFFPKAFFWEIGFNKKKLTLWHFVTARQCATSTKITLLKY